MDFDAPTSYHLDLYRYWDAKRGSRKAPTRRDLDPLEIVKLLPNVALVEPEQNGYRWRLMGTAIAGDFGRDLTGKMFGEYVAPTNFVKDMTAGFDMALALCAPIFDKSLFETDFGSVHAVSRLILPLIETEGTGPMLIFTRIVRRFYQIAQVRDHMKGAKGMVLGRDALGSFGELERRVAEWEQTVAEPSPAGIGSERIASVHFRKDEC
jgi:PAS domain-containing protein